jgi:hypothetical protein
MAHADPHARAGVRVGRLALAVLALLLVGCSGDGDGSADASPSPRVSVLPGTADDEFVGARTDVGAVQCARDGDTWRVSGTVRNPLDVPADYRVYSAFVDGSGTTRDVTQIDVPAVGPREVREWGGSANLATDGLECVLRVERVAEE